MARLLFVWATLGAVGACSHCYKTDSRRLASKGLRPTLLARPVSADAAAGRADCAAACAAPLLAAPAAALASDGGDGAAADGEVRLAAAAFLFFVTVLVDSGRAPVDARTEPELFAFQSENALLDASAFTLLRGYKRAVSPNLPKNCRFLPTCSEYTALAIQEFGFARGFTLFVWRLLRCSPLGGKGLDYPQWPPPSFNAGKPLDQLRNEGGRRQEEEDAATSEDDGASEDDAVT
ncbi:hemolytic domain-containing protein [Pelagophyceae sp. CCMP2097]|nr:hemolytic domain-containing protein [Pelagophyceae sp. CCMP2097]